MFSCLRSRISCSVLAILYSSDLAQKLGLKYEFALLVLLARFEGLIVFPTYSLLALLAEYVADDVTTGCHVSFAWFALGDVYDAIKEVGFPMLAAEVPAYNVVVVGEVCLAVLAAIDPVRIEVDVVCQPHLDCE